MPTQVPLLNRGEIPLRQSGTMVARTARLEAGNTGAGRALQGVGAQLADMAQKEQQANDARLMIDAEGEMRAAVDRQSQFQQTEQEQDKWLPQWEEEKKGLQKHIDGLAVSDSARLNLTQSFGRFADSHTLNIRGQAFDQAKTRTRTAFQTRYQEAARSGDTEAIGTISRLPDGGTMSKEEREAMASDALFGAKKVKLEQTKNAAEMALKSGNFEEARLITGNASSLYDDPNEHALDLLAINTKADLVQFEQEADKNPRLILETLNARNEDGKPKYWKNLGVDYIARNKAENYALAKLADYQDAERLNLANDLAQGKIVTSEQLKFNWLEPSEQASIKEKMDKKLTGPQMAEIRRSLEVSIKGYSKDKDPSRDQMINIATTLSKLPDSTTGDLRQSFYERISGAKKATAQESGMKDVHEQVGMMFDRGVFGNFKEPDPKDSKKERENITLWNEAARKKQAFQDELTKRIEADPKRSPLDHLSDLMTTPIAEAVARGYSPQPSQAKRLTPEQIRARLSGDANAINNSLSLPER